MQNNVGCEKGSNYVVAIHISLLSCIRRQPFYFGSIDFAFSMWESIGCAAQSSVAFCVQKNMLVLYIDFNNGWSVVVAYA